MLRTLSIQNYALIDSLIIDFDSGFSVITGETGAGKSIILGALSLILGQRADARHIKQNESKCTIEGVFDISKYELEPFFEVKDWVFDSNECILRREIWANGKSRAFVNDSPVYLNDLKELGEKLIDIHSQHQNLSLNDNLFQLTVVDLLANTRKERADYFKAFTEFRNAGKLLDEKREQSRRNREEEDFIRFQFAGLSEASLKAGEQAELETELEAITHSEEIKSALFAVSSHLSGEGQNIESVLRSVLDNLKSIEHVYPKVKEWAERVESAYIDLKDVSAEAGRHFEKIDFDPARQEFVEERLSVMYDLQKKHSVSSVEELMALQDGLRNQIENIASMDEQLSVLEQEVAEKQSVMFKKATELSEKRRAVVPEMEKQLTGKLSYLGMANTKFQCVFTQKNQPDATGTDHVQFLFSANKNTALQPVSQIASGGEISRFMLCLKSMIAGATALPTIIFDEIDTGTSGEIADKMGTIMHEMSDKMQVIAISHLPQIAAKGDTHFVVYKADNDKTTTTYMRKLSPDERVQEVARMLSGAEVTAQAVENAKVMINAG